MTEQIEHVNHNAPLYSSKKSKIYRSKGQIGEDKFKGYFLAVYGVTYWECKEATLQENKHGVDFFVKHTPTGRVITFDIKNNFNEKYNNYFIELEQLIEGCTPAWVEHSVDYIAFLNPHADQTDGNLFLCFTPGQLKKISQEKIPKKEWFSMKRYQGAHKGGYLIVAMPYEWALEHGTPLSEVLEE